MMRRFLPFGLFALFAIVITSCGPTETAIATAIAQTAQVQAFQALGQTMTAVAQATDTPTATATLTLTPTATDTPAPTATPEPPLGMAYVPNFVGMELSEAEESLEDGHWRYIWVAEIHRDMTEWQVIGQSPEPGTLITIREDRIRIVVAVHEFTPTPLPVPRSGSVSPDPCGGITYVGMCDGTVCLWCQDNQLWYLDCATFCGGTCGYAPVEGIYACFCP